MSTHSRSTSLFFFASCTLIFFASVFFAQLLLPQPQSLNPELYGDPLLSQEGSYQELDQGFYLYLNREQPGLPYQELFHSPWLFGYQQELKATKLEDLLRSLDAKPKWLFLHYHPQKGWGTWLKFGPLLPSDQDQLKSYQLSSSLYYLSSSRPTTPSLSSLAFVKRHRSKLLAIKLLDPTLPFELLAEPTPSLNRGIELTGTLELPPFLYPQKVLSQDDALRLLLQRWPIMEDHNTLALQAPWASQLALRAFPEQLQVLQESWAQPWDLWLKESEGGVAMSFVDQQKLPSLWGLFLKEPDQDRWMPNSYLKIMQQKKLDNRTTLYFLPQRWSFLKLLENFYFIGLGQEATQRTTLAYEQQKKTLTYHHFQVQKESPLLAWFATSQWFVGVHPPATDRSKNSPLELKGWWLPLRKSKTDG